MSKDSATCYNAYASGDSLYEPEFDLIVNPVPPTLPAHTSTPVETPIVTTNPESFILPPKEPEAIYKQSNEYIKYHVNTT